MTTQDDERARGKIRGALGVAEPEPGLRSRVITSMPIDLGFGGSRRQLAAGGVALVLALAVVASLVLTRQGGTSPQSASEVKVVGTLDMTTQVGVRWNLPVGGYPAP